MAGRASLSARPWRNGNLLHNAAFVLDHGEIIARRAKYELPNYGVFDEKRVFNAGPCPGPVAFRGFRVGLMICEDWWFPEVSENAGGVRGRIFAFDQRFAV